MVVSIVRMRYLVRKWSKVKASLEEKQKNKQAPSICHTSQLTDHRVSLGSNPILHEQSRSLSHPRAFDRSPSPKATLTTSPHSGYPKWDSSRPVSPPAHPRDGLSARVYGSPSPDPSLSRLDQQLARLRQTINNRSVYNERYSRGETDHAVRVSDHAERVSDHVALDTEYTSRVSDHAARIRSERVVPERDTDVPIPTDEDDGTGTLSDISNYISRLEAVQNRLTDLKLSSYNIYDSNKSVS